MLLMKGSSLLWNELCAETLPTARVLKIQMFGRQCQVMGCPDGNAVHRGRLHLQHRARGHTIDLEALARPAEHVNAGPMDVPLDVCRHVPTGERPLYPPRHVAAAL